MYGTKAATATAVAVLLAVLIKASTVLAGPITPTLPGPRDGAFQRVAEKKTPTIAELKFRQEVRKRVMEQLQEQKKMQIDQNLLLTRQRQLMEQYMKKQTTQARRQKLKNRQAKNNEDQKRNSLRVDQQNEQTQIVQRNEQPKTARKTQRQQQEQSVKEEYPALMRYYESLRRRIQRAQRDRIEAPAKSIPGT